jgi:hypothetical protein
VLLQYPSSPLNSILFLHFCQMRKGRTLHLLRDFSISFEKEVCIASIFSCICLTWDSIVKAFVMGFSASLLAISIASLVVLRWKTCSSSSISLSYMRRVVANERRGRHSKRAHQLDSISPERHTHQNCTCTQTQTRTHQSEVSLRRRLLWACCFLFVGRYRVSAAPGNEAIRWIADARQCTFLLRGVCHQRFTQRRVIPPEGVEFVLHTLKLVLYMLSPLKDCATARR